MFCPGIFAQEYEGSTIRRKYREERDKRLKVKGRADYIYQGELAERYDTDAWAPTDGAREPIARDFEAVIVGGGFAGLLAAGNLRKHGVAPEDLCIVERGSDFGGTWYWNRYPGLSCDTEAYVYLPLLEETGYVPEEKYARGPELLEHSQRIGRHFGLSEAGTESIRRVHTPSIEHDKPNADPRQRSGRASGEEN